MIEQDVYTHLKGDATLDTLLSASGSDSKIYPETAKIRQQASTPFIVYSTVPLDPDEILDGERIEFSIIDTDINNVKDIELRVKFLLEIKDDYRVGVSPPTEIPSSIFYIYDVNLSGGTQFPDPDTKRFIRVVIYNFLFKKKA